MSARIDYQQKAMECLKAAEALHDPGERLKMLRVAQDYIALSLHVSARHDHGTAHRQAKHDPEHHPDDA